MLSKNELKYIQSLCQKKQRQEERVFIAEGVKLAEELLQNRYPIRKIYATADWVPPKTASLPVITITEEELEKISQLQTPNKVVVIAEQQELTDEPQLNQGLSLALDGIQDPGNLGTIIRIADWFGIQQIIAGEHTAELYNPKVIQSTMGSFMRVKVWYRPLPELLSTVKVPVFGALLEGKSIHTVGKTDNAVLVIGNESKGISPDIKPFITDPVTIPRLGGAESLNAAVATGIIVSGMRS